MSKEVKYYLLILLLCVVAAFTIFAINMAALSFFHRPAAAPVASDTVEYEYYDVMIDNGRGGQFLTWGRRPKPAPTCKDSLQVVPTQACDRTWHTTASWYAKPGDSMSRRYPAAYWRGWRLTVGEFWPGVAFNALPLYSVVRVTNVANGKSIVALVVDRIGFENPLSIRKRIDLTWTAFWCLADPKTGLLKVKVEEMGGKR